MVLNELIEKYSINVISRHTRIAVEYLEALVERNCSKLKRVQAFGFISILEREYGVDLSNLKKECKEYFEAHPDSGVVLEGKYIAIFASPPEDDEEPTTPEEKNSKLKSYLNKILIALVVIIIAYGSWQMFVPKGLGDINATIKESNGSNKGFFDSVVAMFKKEEKNSTKETQKEKTWDTKKEQKPKVENSKKQEPKKPQEKPKPKKESQDSIEAKIIEQVKKEEAQKAQNPQEDNTPQISDLISNATAGVDDIVDDSKIDTTDTLDTQVPSMAEDNQEQKQQEKPKPKPKPKKEPKKEKTTRGKYKTITFHPRAKVWVGYTNLTTMKRAVATGADDITLDVSKDSYILATGHGRVEFLSGNKELLKLGDGKKHFFKITKNGVKEISHEEFQKLNKSKVW